MSLDRVAMRGNKEYRGACVFSPGMPHVSLAYYVVSFRVKSACSGYPFSGEVKAWMTT